MIVYHFGGHEQVPPGNLDVLLAIRFGDGFNEYSIYDGAEAFPSLIVMVHRELACIHYLPEEGHPGFQSVGNIPSLPTGGFHSFRTHSVQEEQMILNTAVVWVSDALKVMREFVAFPNVLPTAIRWFEL